MKQDLYFIRCGDRVKIGKSQDPKRRLEIMQSGNPRRLRLQATLPGQGPQESVWHAAFCNDRLTGEWFRASAGLTAAMNAAAAGEQWIATLASPADDISAFEWRAIIANAEDRLAV